MLFRSKGSFTVDHRGGKPVIYMHLASADMVKYAVQMLRLIIKHSPRGVETKESGDQQQDIIELIGEIYNTIKQGSAKLHKIKHSIAHLSKLANDTSALVSRSVDSIIAFYTKYDMFKVEEKDGDTNNTNYSTEDMSVLIDWVKENQTIPSRDQIIQLLGLTEVSIRKRGGVRELKKILRKHIAKVKKQVEPSDSGSSDEGDSDGGVE